MITIDLEQGLIDLGEVQIDLAAQGLTAEHTPLNSELLLSSAGGRHLASIDLSSGVLHVGASTVDLGGPLEVSTAHDSITLDTI